MEPAADIVIEPCDGYLRIVYRGELSGSTLGESGPLFSALIRAVGETKLTDILFDVRDSRHELTIMDRYDAAQTLAAMNGLNLRIAILSLAKQVLPDRFFEVTATNRGATVRVVTEEAEAISWLRGGRERAGS